jgi:Cu/Ag efflux pump CusA
MTLATVAGLLTVLVVAVRGSVMLVHRYQQLRAEGVPFGSDLVARGAQDRLGPTVRTAAITAGLLLPAIAFGHVAGQEILYPMAVVMMGGLVTAAFATLGVLPALYARFAARAEPEPWVLDAELDLIEEKPPLAVTTAGD